MRKIRLSLLVVIMVAMPLGYKHASTLWEPIYQKVAGKMSVNDVIERYGAEAESRLVPYFATAGIAYPPNKIVLLAVKDERKLELWASDDASLKFIRTYDVKAASGVLGPKLAEGDRQVPEGIYQLEYLNPNSAYHLSMKINYPNAFDLKYAREEGRNQPGTNIFIHGKAVSIGCLAMGDQTIEELFVLVAKIGRKNVEVAIAPSDPRKGSILALAAPEKPWVLNLYTQITTFFQQYRHDAL